MNYFELFSIPVDFNIDSAALKGKYYELSKRYHPDFNLSQDVEEQIKSLEISSKLNQAYKLLKSFDGRLKYILELKALIADGEKFDLAPEFLMDMMDINESIMELELEAFEEEKLAALNQTLQNSLAEQKQLIQGIIDTFDYDSLGKEEALALKTFYYKQKYLLRISKSLDKFAPS